MTWVIIAGYLVAVGRCALAALFLFAMLRAYDHLADHRFRAAMGVMKGEPLALALYYGCRVLAVAILFGLILS